MGRWGPGEHQGGQPPGEPTVKTKHTVNGPTECSSRASSVLEAKESDPRPESLPYGSALRPQTVVHSLGTLDFPYNNPMIHDFMLAFVFCFTKTPFIK